MIFQFLINHIGVIKDIAEILSNLGVFVASVSAIIIAWLSFDIWKKQKNSELVSKVALNYLKALLNLRDTIQSVRNPYISPDEMMLTLLEEGKSKEEALKMIPGNKDLIRLVYARRWKPLNTDRQNLQKESYECEVLFGEDFINLQDEINKIINELFIELKKYLDGYIANNSDFEKNQEAIYNYDNSFTDRLSDYYKRAKFFFKKYVLLEVL